jgi:hypothetical protein
MVVVSNKPVRFFASDRDEPGPGAATPADGLAPYSVEDLFADPEVCRRVGRIIAKGAERRRPQGGTVPLRNSSDGSKD